MKIPTLDCSDFCIITGTGLLGGGISGPPGALAGCLLAIVIVAVKKKEVK